MKNQIVTITFTIIFLGVMFGSLFNVSMGMNMMGDMSNCPFMENGSVLCPMNSLGHIEAWQDSFLAIVPTAVLITAALLLLGLAITSAPNLLGLRKLLYQRIIVYPTLSVQTFPKRPLQELFASGILHPKLF